MGSDVTFHQRCPKCSLDNTPGSRFCNGCGASLSVVSAEAAERKQVSVLFSDLTGFTALTEKLDPEETRQIIGQIFEAATGIVSRYEGRIEKFVGDAIMAIFGVPLAHEDDPQRAVRAALELHEAVAAMSPAIEARTGVKLGMHSGVNTGVVVTGELQFEHGTAGPLGDTINTAARLMNGAPSGQIWIGPETIQLVEDAFDLEDLGKQDFKGKASAISVARVAGARDQSSAGLAPERVGDFVGRQAELGALLEAAELIRDNGSAAIGLCGDAGTGKTRLVGEFRIKVADNVQWMEGRAYPYGQDTPYSMFTDLLNRIWKIKGSESPTEVRNKVIAGLHEIFGDDPLAKSLYLHLYGLEQDDGVFVERESFREQLLGTILMVLRALAKRGPLVVCFQDLHWADASSRQLLGDLAGDMQPGVLLLANYRPEYTPPETMKQMTLGELSVRQSGELLHSLLQQESPTGLVEFVAARCDGNPFFVEEVVNALVDSGVLQLVDGHWVLTRPLTETSVPATVRSVIAARIDRLDEPRRKLLRHASVVGREFMVKVLAMFEEGVADLMPGLHSLQTAGLIRQHRLEPDVEYMFKHALTQDVAYEGLLKADRQKLHALTAGFIEEIFSERLPEYIESLAFHFQRGGLTDKAIHYLVQAGKKSMARYALTEAGNHYRQAYALILPLERSANQLVLLTDLLNAWSQVHYYEGTIKEWRERLEEHLPDAEACGDVTTLVTYLGWLGNARCFHGDFGGGAEALDRAHLLAQSNNNPRADALVAGWRSFATVEKLLLREAIADLKATKYSAEDQQTASYGYVKAQAGLAHAYLYSGEIARGREVSSALVALGKATGNSRAETMGHFFLAWMNFMAADFDGVIAEGQAGIKSARDPNFQALTASVTAVGHLLKLDTASARILCDEWQPYLDNNENRWFGLQIAMVRAVVDLTSGDLSKGLRDFGSTINQARRQQQKATVWLGEIFLLITYVSVVRMDVKPTIAALIKNPWFTLTQAPLAARKAKTLAARLIHEFDEHQCEGLGILVQFIMGRLLVHQRKTADAEQCLERMRILLRAQGVDQDSASVSELALEISQRKK